MKDNELTTMSKIRQCSQDNEKYKTKGKKGKIQAIGLTCVCVSLHTPKSCFGGKNVVLSIEIFALFAPERGGYEVCTCLVKNDMNIEYAKN